MTMRKWMWLSALGLGLAWGGGAQAQQAMTWGPVIGPLQYKVITGDTSQFPIGGTFQRPTGFRLTDLFHTPTPFTSRPTPGHTVFPTFGQLPGASYLSPFQVMQTQRAK
jgi:hypothetical protein